MIASLSPASVPSWPAVARRFKDWFLAVGIGPYRRGSERGVIATNRNGRLVGVLTVDPVRGFAVVVDPKYRRRGIASRLLAEALKHWPLDLDRERYTPDGAAWINAWRARQ